MSTRILFPHSVAAVAILAAACSSTGAAGAYRPAGSSRTPATGAGRTPTSSPLGTAEQDVIPQYRRFHAIVESALATDDATEIRTVATGTVAAALEQNVRDQVREGIVRRGHSALNPRAFTLPDGRRALVTDCLVSSGFWAFRRDTGARTGPPPRPVQERFRALLTKDGETWKVSETSVPANTAC